MTRVYFFTHIEKGTFYPYWVKLKIRKLVFELNLDSLDMKKKVILSNLIDYLKNKRDTHSSIIIYAEI